MGCHLDSLSLQAPLAMGERFIRSGPPHRHAAVNRDKLVKASCNAQLRKVINGCALASADPCKASMARRTAGLA